MVLGLMQTPKVVKADRDDLGILGRVLTILARDALTISTQLAPCYTTAF